MSRLYKGQCNDYTDLDGQFTYVEYTSIQQFIDMLHAKRISSRDNSSEDTDSDWSGTSSLDEAITLLTKGDKESLTLLKDAKAITDVMFKDVEVKRPKNVNSVEGHQPIVPHAIMGLPESMIKTVRQPKKNKVVNIFINSSQSGGTKKEDIAFHGAMMLSAIEQLEKNGYRVGIYVGKIAYLSESESLTGHIVNIKQPMAPLNILKCSFYMVNPSFLRRICFKIDETEPKIEDCTHSGYGQATNYDNIEDVVTNTFREKMLVYDNRIDIDKDNSNEENIDNMIEFLSGYLEHNHTKN